MKQLKRDLQAMLKDLKALTKKAEKLQVRVAKIDKAQTKAKAKVKPRVAKKADKLSAPQVVLGLIQASKEALDTKTLREKTGIDPRLLQSTLYRLVKQSKIKRVGKGLYAYAKV